MSVDMAGAKRLRGALCFVWKRCILVYVAYLYGDKHMNYAWRRVMRVRLKYVAFVLVCVLGVCGCERESGNIIIDKVVNTDKTEVINTDDAVEAGGEGALAVTEAYVYEGNVLADIDGFGVCVSRKNSDGIGEIQSYLLNIQDHSATVQSIKFDEQEKVVGSSKFECEVDTETVEELCGKSDAEHWEYIYSMVSDLIADVEPKATDYIEDDSTYSDIISVN